MLPRHDIPLPLWPLDYRRPYGFTFTLPTCYIKWYCCTFNKVWISIWASSWDYGTYHIGDQPRLRQACASTQSRQSLRCSHTCSLEVDEGSDQKSDIYPHWMTAHALLKTEFMEDKKYHNLMRWLIFLSWNCSQMTCERENTNMKQTYELLLSWGNHTRSLSVSC